MFVVPAAEREWIAWIKDQVARRELPCMAGCRDKATRIKFLGKRTGAFCGSCYSEIFHGTIPKLDRPKGLKRARRRR
jgi:hypothetical protein